MWRKERKPTDKEEDARLGRYPLDWPPSQRWNPLYNVPRNSVDSRLEAGDAAYTSARPKSPAPQLNGGPQSDAVQTPINDLQTKILNSSRDEPLARQKEQQAEAQTDAATEDFSNLVLWLETLGELYMNDLDNRARWLPRWLNVTRDARFEGLTSVTATIVDFCVDASDSRKVEVVRSPPLNTKTAFAEMLQEGARPADSAVRFILVEDLSRFVMGALGHMFKVDPEFWFEHLVNSGYAPYDSALKYRHAAMMNWAEREIRFRHRALPGLGQRTVYTTARRVKDRQFFHYRWGRLGVLNYLGRKGFYETEIERRLADGRTLMERDVTLDKNGLLLTRKRQVRLEKARKKAEKEAKKKAPKKMRKGTAVQMPGKKPEEDGTTSRKKCSNIYRAYSTFDSLPRNPTSWTNRDLRVFAPEGVSYWSGLDQEGKPTVIVIFDPLRKMKQLNTKKVTPSLTFMPRQMEIEAFTEDELWNMATAEETYLDPPPPPLSKEEMKKQRKEARKKDFKEKKQKLEQKLKLESGHEESGSKVTSQEKNDREREIDYYDDTSSSDSEYDEDYEKSVRTWYEAPRQNVRDRDFGRKYALSTQDVFYRHLCKLAPQDIMDHNFLVPSVLTRIALEDSWDLLSEIRISLDYVDVDLAVDYNMHLLDSIATNARLNLNWSRNTLQELSEWLSSITATVSQRSDLTTDEHATLLADTTSLASEVSLLQTRVDKSLSTLTAAITLAQSSLVIAQTSGINKLTELAFLFVPLSFVTGIFSMQVNEFLASPPRIWTWGVSLSSLLLLTYLLRIMLRSPTVRYIALQARVTILNRYSPPKSKGYQLNEVGNRAAAKYICIVTLSLCIVIFYVSVYVFIILLIFFGVWLGIAVTAVTFIVLRWPDPRVLVPCFLCLPPTVVGAAWVWYWSDEISDWMAGTLKWSLDQLLEWFPSEWKLDRPDDEDLATEGLKTFGRQAIVGK